ncbi:cytochrome bd-I ubiquinol oxidase subunit 2 apoprotein [Kaistia soli DSM 19436]|uniref:Cytochrome bd-I ubiquinol oxidase subunit 2 apoprotein n=1 Tax=Kaistia soli DSM 19436 TaxID=1122133 RepID=A0A1M5L5P1_9HYPH|nr:cytochrome d ubiquinol oxidase subunit II [Kaistia soli]SHG60255.1 cytochrome bd-I ubiquinol oxidase subunit 2 apoprotein [Kaistia soli DSM 19436]
MTEFWTAALALSILLYVLLDGFDLGVGMLLALMPNERGRRHMLRAIAPVWDGNETWLVIAGTILFGVFPLVYATLLSAFYLPIIVMLTGLILRGVSFEFREKSRHPGFWTWCFILGSLVATFVQGVAIGALVEGLPIADGRYVGGAFGWLSPFAVLCGIALLLGYALLGAGWLTRKTTDDVQAFAFGVLPRLLVAVLVLLAAIFAYSLALDLAVMNLWLERPVLIVFPVIGALASAAMALAIRRRMDLAPFLCGAVIFAAAFATLAVSFYPYIIPFSVTIAEAAAPHASQSFMFWGAGIVVLPITLAYTISVYFVFKGKVDPDASYGQPSREKRST